VQTNQSSVNYSISAICDFAASEPLPPSAGSATWSVRLLRHILGRRARALLEAIGQSRGLSPELKELFILLGDLVVLALEAIGQIADLLPELNEIIMLLRLCATSRCELLAQSFVTALLFGETLD